MVGGDDQFLVMSLHDLEGRETKSNSRSYKVKIKFKENIGCILSNSIKNYFLNMHDDTRSYIIFCTVFM